MYGIMGRNDSTSRTKGARSAVFPRAAPQKGVSAVLNAVNLNSAALSERVADGISRHIIESKLVKGDRLPNEQILSESFQVGRSTVREAIKLLASRNVVEIVRGRGTFVAGTPGITGDPLGFFFVQDKRKLVFDLLEMRMILETASVGLAAQRATQEEICQMRELNLQIEELIGKGKSHAAKDIELHVLIARSSKNDVMSVLVPILNKAILIFLAITGDTLLKETLETHRAMVEAIANRDEQAAQEAIRRHLLLNRARIEAELEKKDCLRKLEELPIGKFMSQSPW